MINNNFAAQAEKLFGLSPFTFYVGSQKALFNSIPLGAVVDSTQQAGAAGRRTFFSSCSAAAAKNMFNIQAYSVAQIKGFSTTNILKTAVTKFFKHLNAEKKYFLLLKIKFKAGNIASLHQGLIITKKSLNSYLEFLAGIPRNSVSFEEIKSVFNGAVISKNINNVFNHDLNNLNIHISNSIISIQCNPDKALINNKYIPKEISDLTDVLNNNESLVWKLVRKFRLFLSRIPGLNSGSGLKEVRNEKG
jgi:hypothetical protein